MSLKTTYKIAIYSAVLFAGNLYAQDGFRVIHKAEKKIEQGNYDRALKLLEKADSMDYGFCGNAWIEAEEVITINKAKIFSAQGDPMKAANLINEGGIFMIAPRDSLKMAYYAQAVGKERLRREIDSCIERIPPPDSIDYFFSELRLNVSFCDQPIVLDYWAMNRVRIDMALHASEESDMPTVDRMKAALRRQDFYKPLL